MSKKIKKRKVQREFNTGPSFTITNHRHKQRRKNIKPATGWSRFTQTIAVQMSATKTTIECNLRS